MKVMRIFGRGHIERKRGARRVTELERKLKIWNKTGRKRELGPGSIRAPEGGYAGEGLAIPKHVGRGLVVSVQQALNCLLNRRLDLYVQSSILTVCRCLCRVHIFSSCEI